jgi:hypothetical protein
MSIRLSCPSCNTNFVLDALPPAHRATCPRCGDPFPVRGSEEDPGEWVHEPGVRGEESADRNQDNGTRQASAPAGGLSARTAVLGAAVLGLLGFAVGLMVYYSHETNPGAGPPAPPIIAATPPARLAGLGYLPAECNVVLAIQPGPILDHAAHTGQDPRQELVRAGVPEQVLSALEAGGLSLAQIDHIAAGVYLPDGLGEFRVALVLVLKEPLADEGPLRAKLKARADKQKYETVEIANLPLPLLMKRVSPTVWVFGWNEGDFSAVEKGGFGPGGTQFRGSDADGLRKMLASVPEDAAVWVAADDDHDWSKKPLVGLLGSVPDVKKMIPNLGGVLSAGRGGVFALTVGDPPRMRLFVRTADPALGERLRTYFQARAAETESATAGGAGVYALFDGPFELKTLQRFFADLK